MDTTISATFESRIGARDAIADLMHFGLTAADISVAEAVLGTGTIFGTAQTLTPGRGSTDISTIVQPVFPQSTRGGMPAGLVAADSDDILGCLLDFGLSEEVALVTREAIENGSLLLAATVPESVVDAVMEVLHRNGGTVAVEPESPLASST